VRNVLAFADVTAHPTEVRCQYQVDAVVGGGAIDDDLPGEWAGNAAESAQSLQRAAAAQ